MTTKLYINQLFFVVLFFLIISNFLRNIFVIIRRAEAQKVSPFRNLSYIDLQYKRLCINWVKTTLDFKHP